jgi:hypothetical protein
VTCVNPFVGPELEFWLLGAMEGGIPSVREGRIVNKVPRVFQDSLFMVGGWKDVKKCR